MKFQVELDDLRQALAAVLPHAAKENEYEHFARVRFWVDPINLTVGATNTITIGMSIVSMQSDGDLSLVPGEDGQFPWFDLRPDDVKKILAVHKTRKVSGEDVEQTVLFDVQDESVVTHDISGLFAGEEYLAVPHADADDRFVDIPARIGSWVHQVEDGLTTYRAEPLGLSGPALAAFVTSGRAHGFAPVLRLVEHADGKFIGLVTVGESFIGAVTARDIRELLGSGDEEAMQAWESWVNRLPARYVLTAPDDDSEDL